MNLDVETIDALGHGSQWEQLAIRWPLYVIASARRSTKDRRGEDRAARDAAYYQRKKARAAAAKLEKRRAQYRESKRRSRERRSIARSVEAA